MGNYHFTTFGDGYQLEDEIPITSIKGFRSEFVKPRVSKSKSDQAKRIKNKAEVFTPSWASEDIIRNATEQALAILSQMQESKESFRKLGLTFEEKDLYDILISQRDAHNFVYGEDKTTNGIVINERCKSLAKKIKEIIDTKSSFADWLNIQNIRNDLKLDIKIYLIKNGYPPQYSSDVFGKVMEQVENFEKNKED